VTGRAATHDRRLELLTGCSDDRVLACEADVLGHWYGITIKDLEDAYGAYADTTVWLVIRNSEGDVDGWCRIITPGVLPLKTMTDISRPRWEVDGPGAAAEAGVDLTHTWDVATVGVRPQLGATRGSATTFALYHGLKLAMEANGAQWLVAVLDVRVRQMLNLLGLRWRTLPGTTPRPYMGSVASVPIYGDVPQVLREQRLLQPDDYRRITLGAGVGDIQIPPHHSFWLPSPAVIDVREHDTHIV